MGRDLPAAQTTASSVWLPIIPLCTEALAQRIPRVERARMTSANLDRVVKMILGRFKAVVPLLLPATGFSLLRGFLAAGQPLIRVLVRKPLRNAIEKQLGDAYQGPS